MARDYHQEYLDRNERARDLGFDDDAERREARRAVREDWGVEFSAYDPRLDAAAYDYVNYSPGDATFSELKEMWMDWHGYEDDWEPDDDFYDWLDEMSGEPA